jgi:dienelactone hydrolase
MPAIPPPDPQTFPRFIQEVGRTLAARNVPPAGRPAWARRRQELIAAMSEAMGLPAGKPCPLEPKVLGSIQRQGYRIEKLIFQSQPDVWVTANAYVPEPLSGKAPAVLCVHGHWPWARIDPTVQARCLGLVKLGFFVLAVDAFGSGERYTTPARGTYHGALYGATTWPPGTTLLGLQVYDNRRAVDYLLTRDEVDGSRLGITGASGGGNQSMYAGAMDDRLQAVVPVCSVGSYQAYLRAACCVCEVLPGALRFTEEGDVLGLVAPRALLVISAAKDAYQFSPTAAQPTVERARAIFGLEGAGTKFQHTVFDSAHDYNKPMRELMYGWMSRWLRQVGDGSPIAESAISTEPPEDLRCFPGGRPANWLTVPAYAARVARSLPAVTAGPPTHAEEWDSTATYRRSQVIKLLGGFPPPPRLLVDLDAAQSAGGVTVTPMRLMPEPGLPLAVTLKSRGGPTPMQPACVLLHLDGAAAALDHPLAGRLIERGWMIAAPDLRATGAARPPGDAVRNTPDHNSAEHAVWVGRSLLGQWAFDVQCLLDWLIPQPGLDRRRLTVIGLGQAGLVALVAGGLLPDRAAAVVSAGGPTSLITPEAYENGFHMGLLAPGLLRAGDVPQLAALAAPRRLVIADGVTPLGSRVSGDAMRQAFAFTEATYRAARSADRLTLVTSARWEDIAAGL